jgi:hemerythrin-like domain-containing protein
MNAIDFLCKEHSRVRTMLRDISDASHHFETQRKKFATLADDLIRHETMERTVWYPHFKNKLPGTVQHLVSEEKHAERAIKQLDELESKEAWRHHFLKFKENVEHHAEEEEDELFPEIKKLLSEQELDEIGEKMYDFKKNYS